MHQLRLAGSQLPFRVIHSSRQDAGFLSALCCVPIWLQGGDRRQQLRWKPQQLLHAFAACQLLAMMHS